MPPVDPIEELRKLIAKLAEVFAASYQVIVVILLALFVIVVGFFMVLFRIFTP